MSIASIQSALDKAFKKFGIDNGIDATLPNIEYKPDLTKPYLESVQMHTGKGTADLGVTNNQTGIYQINIRYPAGTGTHNHLEMCDLLETIFKTDACFYHDGVCVTINSFEPGDILPVNGWAVMPVSIYWDCYTARL